MKPRKPSGSPNDDLFRSCLDNIINLRQELVLLSEKIDWSYSDEQDQYTLRKSFR